MRTPEAKDRDLLREAFAVTVRALRAKRNLAQEKLANEAGIDRGYMSGLERAKHTPTVETIWRLLPILKVSFAQFGAEFERSVRATRKVDKQSPEGPGPETT